MQSFRKPEYQIYLYYQTALQYANINTYTIYTILYTQETFYTRNLSTCTRTNYFAHYGIDSGSTGEIHYVKYLVSYTLNKFNTYNTFNIILSFTKISFLCNVIFLSTANVHNTRQCLDILLQPIRLKLVEPPQNAVIVHITQPQTIVHFESIPFHFYILCMNQIYTSVFKYIYPYPVSGKIDFPPPPFFFRKKKMLARHHGLHPTVKHLPCKNPAHATSCRYVTLLHHKLHYCRKNILMHQLRRPRSLRFGPRISRGTKLSE